MLRNLQICFVNRYLPFFACGLLVTGDAGHAQTGCPEGTLWEPYSQVCAPVRDVRTDFLALVEKSSTFHSDAPVPGTMTTGTAYATGQLAAVQAGRLHTQMFVYPDGLERDATLPSWLYTTATSRVDDGLEVVAMYSESRAAGYLGLYAWTCLPGFPCPDGAVSPDWQWSRPLTELACNVTQVVDPGGHAQKQLYYANHSDRLDSGSPPLWRSAVYLWNYCDSTWDLAWEHSYRQYKDDCSLPEATCAWWGPSIEIFGDAMYPRIGELGYADSLLYHDGTWSVLAPPETQFRDPANPDWGALTPWQLFHLEPNHSYGVGNWVNENDAPVIEGQQSLTLLAGEVLTVSTNALTITDADVDPAYHVAYELTVYGGNNYSVSDAEVTPDPDFTGTLRVPVSVNDGAAESATFELTVEVVPDDGMPVITAQATLSTPEETGLSITLAHFTVWDSNSTYPDDFTLSVRDGLNYTRIGNTITPTADFNGNLTVPVTVDDGTAESPVFNASVRVTAVNDRPVIAGQQPIETLERMPVEITIADLSITDPDSAVSELSIRVLDGTGYQRAGNTITPEPGVIGALVVDVIASDGELDSDIFDLVVQVLADTVPPEITLIGAATVTVQQGGNYADPGASATDNVDGDVSDRIVVDNPVDTGTAGTYTITYSVEDRAGNSSAASRTVIVQLAPPPASSGGGGTISMFALGLLLSLCCRSKIRPYR